MDRVKMVVKADGVDDIVIGEAKNDQVITSLKISLGSGDLNAKVKNSNILTVVEVVGEYAQGTKNSPKPMKQLLDWSKQEATKSNYRQVDLEIFDGDDTDSNRHFVFPEMFVLFYSEDYVANKETKDSTGNSQTSAGFTKFTLILHQRFDKENLEKIVNDLK